MKAVISFLFLTIFCMGFCFAGGEILEVIVAAHGIKVLCSILAGIMLGFIILIFIYFMDKKGWI